MKRRNTLTGLLLIGVVLAGLLIWNVAAENAAAQKTTEFGTVGTVGEYNAKSEFSLTQGGTSGVWSYGYTSGPSSDVFIAYPNTASFSQCTSSPGSDFNGWQDNSIGGGVPQIGLNVSANPFFCGSLRVPTDALYMHPGVSEQRSVLRWTAPTAGVYRVAGVFEGLDNPGSRDVRILKNATGSPLFSGIVSGQGHQSFDFPISVAVGETIDFSVGANGSFTFDATALSTTIGPLPTACLTAPANLQVNVPAENSPTDVASVNTNASLVGDATYTNMGKVGRAFELDGNGDYVRVEDNLAQRPATAVTAEGWFKFDSAPGLVSLISKPLRNSSLNSYTLYLDGGQLRGLVSNGPQFTRVFSSYTPPVGVWQHLAFTYDLTGGVSTLKLYANGVEITTGHDGTANIPIAYDANPFPLLIGGEFENNAPGFTIDGQADEVSVYGRALAATEIFDIVQRGNFGKCAQAPCVQSPNNLVSWFAGEGNALDSKSGNHGTLQNGTTFQTAKVGQGLKFDGVNDFVGIPDNANLKPPMLTLETWVKFDSLTSTVTGGAPSGYQNIIFKKNSRTPGTGFEGGYSLVKNPDNRIGIGFNSAGGGTDFASSTTFVQAGVWYHLVGTHDGTNIRLYVNGQLEGTGTATFPIDYGTTPLYLGNAQVPFSGYFSGVLDETSIYNRALTLAEVQSIYAAGASGKCKPVAPAPPPNQIAWFTGDGDARDLTGLNAAGTLQGNVNYRVGKVGQAFDLDGNDDYVTTADSPNWDFGTGDFALEAWFNAANPTGVQRIISAGAMSDGANNVWALGIGDIGAWGGGQRINLAVFNGSGYNDYSSNQLQFGPGTWHHVGVVRSGTSLNFYLDGAPVGTVAIGAGFAVNGGTTGAIVGARYNNNPSTIFEFLSGRIDEVGVYQRALSASEIAAIYGSGSAGKSKSTAVSVNFASETKRSANLAPSVVQLGDATVTFTQVTSGGFASQSGADIGTLPALPTVVTAVGLAYDISTTATYQSGSADDVQVCFNVPALAANFPNLRIFHLENGAWVNRTATGNVSPNICTDNLTSLSPFVIAQVAPTSAAVSVAGRVSTASGRGLSGAIVTLTDSQGRSVSTRTGSFGRYRFEGVTAGDVYTVTVSAKRFRFAISARAVNVQEAVDDVDFTASETSLQENVSTQRKE